MSNNRHKPEEIVTKLRQVEVLVGQGMARVDAIREVRAIEPTYYRWRKQYGGMGTDQLRELKRLQKENVYRPSEILLMLQGRKRSDEWTVGRQHQAMDGEAQIRARH